VKTDTSAQFIKTYLLDTGSISNSHGVYHVYKCIVIAKRGLIETSELDVGAKDKHQDMHMYE